MDKAIVQEEVDTIAKVTTNFVRQLARSLNGIAIAIGVQQSRSWSGGPRYEAQTLQWRHGVKWRDELPKDIVMLEC